jgi:hypothetical protein
MPSISISVDSQRWRQLRGVSLSLSISYRRVADSCFLESSIYTVDPATMPFISISVISYRCVAHSCFLESSIYTPSLRRQYPSVRPRYPSTSAVEETLCGVSLSRSPIDATVSDSCFLVSSIHNQFFGGKRGVVLVFYGGECRVLSFLCVVSF